MYGNPKTGLHPTIARGRFEHYRFSSGLDLDAYPQDIAADCWETTEH